MRMYENENVKFQTFYETVTDLIIRYWRRVYGYILSEKPEPTVSVQFFQVIMNQASTNE